MRISVTGDIHYDITSQNAIYDLIQRMHEDGGVPVLAGDIAEVVIGVKKFKQCLKMFRNFFDEVLVIPGNHDLWAAPGQSHTSMDLWNTILPDMTQKVGCVYLEHQSFIRSGVAIIGSYLHYDYSAKDKVGVCAGLDDKFYEINKYRANNDANYHIGLPPDQGFAKIVGDAFWKRLRFAEEEDEVKDIVIVTHVPCIEALITRRPQDYEWSVSTPYFGNISWEDKIRSCSKVRAIVSAHSHVGIEHMVPFGDREVLAICIDSDYRSPSHVTIEIKDNKAVRQ